MFKVGDTGTTREGDAYTIVRTDADGAFNGCPQPIVAEIHNYGGTYTREYTSDGFFYDPSSPQPEDLGPPMRRAAPPAADCTIVSLLLAAGHVTEEQVEAAKRLAELAR